MTTSVIAIRRPVSNAFLLLGDRPVLVDGGAPGDEQDVVAALRSLGVEPADLALVVLTHGHADHTGAVSLFAAAGVPVAVGAADAPLLESGVIDELPVTGRAGALPRPFVRRMSSIGVRPQICVPEPFRLDTYGVAASMVPVGGHTAGSSVVLVDGGDAVVGDLVRGGFALGRVRPAHPLRHYFAENGGGVRRALELVLEHHPSTLHVGHGGPGVSAEAVRRRLDSIAPYE